MFSFGVLVIERLIWILAIHRTRAACIHQVPAAEFELNPDECFELLKPLYGLCAASDLWHETLRKHLTYDFNLLQTKTDPSLYFSYDENGELEGINRFYVNELLRAGKEKFKEKC